MSVYLLCRHCIVNCTAQVQSQQRQHLCVNTSVKLTREVAETLMSALGRGGLVAEAQRLWRSMVWGRATLRPDRRTFLTAIRVFREGGALSQALHAYNGMRRAGARRGDCCLQRFAATVRLQRGRRD